MEYIKGKTSCKPEDVNYDSSRIDVLIKHFQKMIDKNEIQSASFCVSRKGKIFLHGAIGPISYNKNYDNPLLPTTVNRIASITKIFTATAIMKLVEDGYTRLDIKVSEILEQFNTPPFNDITIFQLLTHTSGLYPDPTCYPNKHHINQYNLIDNYIKNYKSEDGEFDWISASLGCAPRRKPGQEWQYCTYGFIILGAIIEKLTGVFAEDYIRDNIIKPLNLSDTDFIVSKDMAKRMLISNEENEKRFNSIANGEMSGNYNSGNLWNKIPGTGGGLFSTPYDLNRFGNLFLSKGTLDGVRIIGRKAVEKMTEKVLNNTPDYCWEAKEMDREYGVGFEMRSGIPFTYSHTSFGHEGAGSCSLFIDPKEELVASWFVPFMNNNWYSHGLWNVINIIWSGLK